MAPSAQLLAAQLRKFRRDQGRLSRWRADAKPPKDRGSKAEADQGECGNTALESKCTAAKVDGGRGWRSLRKPDRRRSSGKGLARFRQPLLVKGELTVNPPKPREFRE